MATRERGSESLGLEWGRPISNRAAKARLARLVAKRALDGDVIGVGSGSTSFLTLVALGRRVAEERLAIIAVPTSIEMELACEALRVPVRPRPLGALTWCFDGADEVDPRGWLIKGRGGALYRERQVFAATAKRVVVADASKSVERLGSRVPVPVEVDASWIRVAMQWLERDPSVSAVSLRMAGGKDGPIVTEHGNVILDVRYTVIDAPELERLAEVPGFTCHGVFAGFPFDRVGE